MYIQQNYVCVCSVCRLAGNVWRLLHLFCTPLSLGRQLCLRDVFRVVREDPYLSRDSRGITLARKKANVKSAYLLC